MKRTFRRVTLSILLILPAVVPGLADVAVDSWDLEVWLGAYVPGAAEYDPEISAGLRVRYHRDLRWALAGEFSAVRLTGTPTDPALQGTVENRLSAFELNGYYHFLSDRRTSLDLFAGFGYASSDLSGTLQAGDLEVQLHSQGQHTLTAQGGGGIRGSLGERFYLRPAIEVKWFAERDDDPVDWQFMLGFGVVLVPPAARNGPR